MLQCDGDQLEKRADACVGVGNDGASFAPLLLAFHHDVAVGEGLGEVQDLLALLGDVCRQVLLHVVFDSGLVLTHDGEGVLVKPGVEG